MAIVLPRPAGFSDPAVQLWAERFTASIQQAVDDLAMPARVGVVVSNVTQTTTFDPTTATLVQTAQTLGTLMQAFKQMGRST